jgi:hypothetical protein
MLEGLKALPQPPWYIGYNNRVMPPDVNPMTAASRYGFRGAKNIDQYNTKPYEPPSRTQTDHTPKFLQNNEEYVNEYVPPILATKFNTMNGMETPKLWPENTEYVEGFRKKKLPTLWKYKRETTVDLPERPKSPKLLSMLHSKTLEQSKLLTDYAKMESVNSHQSLPAVEKLKFETNWNDIVTADANKVLKQTMKRIHSPYEPHTLLDPSDTLRYTSSTSLIVHTKSTDELKFRLRMEKTKSKVHTPFALKWQHVIGHFDNINHQLKKHQTMSDAVQKIAQMLKQVAVKNGSETSLKRIEFIQACSLIHYFEGVSEKQLSQLFSIFDPMKKNSMRFVEFILLLTILDRPEMEPIPKLQNLWTIAHQYGSDRNIFDIAFDVLSSCAGSIEDLNEIEKKFKEEFRPKCYEFAIQQKRLEADTERTANDLQNMTALFDPASRSTKNSASETPQVSSPSQRDSPTEKNASYVQHQYNICEHYLTVDTFALVLKHCSNIVQEFDQQLSAKLKLCYGKDDRYKLPEEEFVPTEHLDFTWIIKKPPPKKASFGLFETQDGNTDA